MNSIFKEIKGISTSQIAGFIEQKVLLFRDLPKSSISSISEKFTGMACPKNTVLIHQGEIGDYFYIVISGKFRVEVKDRDGNAKVVGRISSGDCIGEGALVTKEPRNATVISETTSKFLRLSYDDFQEILNLYPGEFQAFVRIVGKRSRTVTPGQFRPSSEKLQKFLSSVPLLSGISSETIAEMESKMEWLFLPGGELLMNQGEPGDCMYIVVNGGFHYRVTDSFNNKVAEGKFSKGDIIGEMALLTGENRSASVYSTRGSELVRFTTRTFNDFILKNPEGMISITRTLAKRLSNELSKGSRPRKQTGSMIITFFPLEMNVPDLENYILNSSGEKSIWGSRRNFLGHLAETRNISLKNIEEIRYELSDIFSWLYKIEDEYDMVYLLCDLSDPLWTETILRHTDKIVLLTASENSPDLTSAEIRFLGEGINEASAPRELVILYHNRTYVPENTIERLNKRSVSAHYHIRLYEPRDIKRLLRCITHKSIGLALGGGGAKGFAHLGLLKSFVENNIEVDIIGGTSAGAIIAALYALGLSVKEMEHYARKYMSQKNILEDYTYPVISLSRGKKFTRALKEFLQDRQIEDLWIPYFAVSTDLTEARKFVFKSGSLWKAVRSSASLPGILPPFYDNGRLLVDGALLDNVPGMVLREFNAGFSIASSLGFQSRVESDRLFRDFYDKEHKSVAPSFLRGLLMQLNPFQKKTGGIGNILMRSTMVNSLAAEKDTSRQVDLFLTLPVSDFGIFDWKEFDEIEKSGYDYIQEKIHSIKNQLSENLLIQEIPDGKKIEPTD